MDKTCAHVSTLNDKCIRSWYPGHALLYIIFTFMLVHVDLDKVNRKELQNSIFDAKLLCII